MSDLLFAVYVAFGGGHRVPLATEDQLPQSDPQGYYRVLTELDATSSSTCIGRADQPICALETALACIARDNDALCRGSLGEGAPTPKSQSLAGNTLRYRIDKVDVLGYPAHLFPNAKVGDLTINVSAVSCRAGSCGQPEGPGQTYYLGKRDGWWQVFGWESVKTTVVN